MRRVPDVELRDIRPGEAELLYEHLRDPAAAHMAAFMVADPDDHAGFEARWELLVADPQVVIRAIVADGELVGHLLAFSVEDDTELSYWIDRDHWGRGIATDAVRAALDAVPGRHVHAKVAIDNLASQRVLVKAGFVEIGRNRDVAPARGEETTEVIFALTRPGGGETADARRAQRADAAGRARRSW